MSLSTEKFRLIILGLTALVFSRSLFWFFDDPEGPNLLIVFVTTSITYLVSLSVYKHAPLDNSLKKFWLAIIAQILLMIGLYILGSNF
ncbi:hypothetical protein KC845_03065 [Candidatus Kaiserbacteria bacterium]|nr:hypothetical protein [Candidatus Kaiserbacteria bacterium]